MKCSINIGRKTISIKKIFLVGIVLLPLLIRTCYDVPVVILLSLNSILAVLVFTFYPYLIKLSSKEEFFLSTK